MKNLRVSANDELAAAWVTATSGARRELAEQVWSRIVVRYWELTGRVLFTDERWSPSAVRRAHGRS